jgi:hypothetical protein
LFYLHPAVLVPAAGPSAVVFVRCVEQLFTQYGIELRAHPAGKEVAMVSPFVRALQVVFFSDGVRALRTSAPQRLPSYLISSSSNNCNNRITIHRVSDPIIVSSSLFTLLLSR